MIQAIVKNEASGQNNDYFVTLNFDGLELPTICHLEKVNDVFFNYQKTLSSINDNPAHKYEITFSKGCQLQRVYFPLNCFVTNNWHQGSTFTFYKYAKN